MRRILLALTMLALVPVPASASATDGVMAPIRQFIDAFNHGNPQAGAAVCDSQASIVDEFPPHEWHGAGACARWAADYNAMAKHEGMTAGNVTLGTPKHVDVTGDRAYVVVPTTFAYKDHGKPASETGSTMTIALRKVAAGWRITGWAWTKH